MRYLSRLRGFPASRADYTRYGANVLKRTEKKCINRAGLKKQPAQKSRLLKQIMKIVSFYSKPPGVDVGVTSGVFVCTGVKVGVLVGLGVLVLVGVLVGLGVKVLVGVFVFVGVFDGVGVALLVLRLNVQAPPSNLTVIEYEP